MKVILNTDNAFQSLRLREQIISGIKGELDNVAIDTWAFTKSGENYDILYHNPSQYVDDPTKNVLFKMDIDGSNISFSTTNEGRNTQVVRDFSVTETVKTDSYIVSYDATHNKILRIKNNNGNIMLKEFNLNYTLKKWDVVMMKSTPAVKAYNDYAFITDDVNEFVAIVTPTSMHLHRYSDIVSITYEENGNDMYNKSLGGAVVGGLLFGGVGAIVGSNTAKAVKNKKIERMSIKILLKSTSDPTILLEIYNSRNDGAILETKKDADKIFYEGLMKEVTGIKDIFSIIIDIVDKSSASQNQQISVSASNSIADELTKLVQLKDAGVLTEEEFQAQKAKLLQ